MRLPVSGEENAMVAVLNEQESDPEDRASNKAGPRRMLKEEQVLESIPVSRTTLYRMEKAGTFPRSIYVSPNRRFWYEDQVVAWQAALDEYNPNRRRGKGRRREVKP
jgi:prophage regulatory protein